MKIQNSHKNYLNYINYDIIGSITFSTLIGPDN